MRKFTKGPWFTHKPGEGSGWVDVVTMEGGTRKSIATAWTMCVKNPAAEVNARLIAASPDMYEALEKLLRMNEDSEASGQLGLLFEALSAAREALRKAREGDKT